MHVVAGGDVVQHAEAMAFAGLVKPAAPVAAIAGEAQQELAFVAAKGDVPDVAGAA